MADSAPTGSYTNWLSSMFSIRFCNIAFFVFFLLVTVAVVSAVLLSFSIDSLTTLQNTSRNTMRSLVTQANSLMNELSEQGVALIGETLSFAVESTQLVSNASMKELTEMSSLLFGSQLQAFKNSVISYMDTISKDLEVTQRFIIDYNMNISKFEDMLSTGRQVFSALRLESSIGVTLWDAKSGNQIIVVDATSVGYPAFAIVVNGSTSLATTYSINMNTSEIVYPEDPCFRSVSYYCFTTYNDLGEVLDHTLARSLSNNGMAWGTPNIEAGEKYISLITTMRDENDDVIGAVTRPTLVSAFQDLLLSAVADPSVCLYMVDLRGLFVATTDNSQSQTEDAHLTQNYINVMAYPESRINGSASLLKAKYLSWVNVPSASLDTFSIYNSSTNSTTEYVVTAEHIVNYNLHWVAVMVTPMRLYLGTIIDINETVSLKVASELENVRQRVEAGTTVAIGQLNDTITSALYQIELCIEDSKKNIRSGVITAGCIAFSVVAVAMLLSVLFTLAITSPIFELIAVLERIARMDLDNIDVTSRSRLSELRAMQDCFSKTVDNLVELRKYMPDTLFVSSEEPSRGRNSIASDAALHSIMSSKEAVCHSALENIPSRCSTSSSAVTPHATPVPASLGAMGITGVLASLMVVDIIGFNQRLIGSLETLMIDFGLYMATVSEAVKDWRGVVDKCIGDKLFCHWNAVTRQASHQMKACNAGFAIKRLLDAAHGFRARISIVSSHAFAGTVGTDRNLSFQIFGPSVNLVFALVKHCARLGLGLCCDQNTCMQVKSVLNARLVDVLPPVESFFAKSVNMFHLTERKVTQSAEWMYELENAPGDDSNLFDLALRHYRHESVKDAVALLAEILPGTEDYDLARNTLSVFRARLKPTDNIAPYK